MNLIKWIQLGNILSETYKKNETTDAYTVGGLAIGPLVVAILTGVMFLQPELGLSVTTIATAGAVASCLASQIVPSIQHILAERNAKKQAEAKAKVDAWAADKLNRHTGAEDVVEWCKGAKTYSAKGLGKTLSEVIQLGADWARLGNGDIWTAKKDEI